MNVESTVKRASIWGPYRVSVSVNEHTLEGEAESEVEAENLRRCWEKRLLHLLNLPRMAEYN